MENPDGTAAVLDETLISYHRDLPHGAVVTVQRGARVDTDDVIATVQRPGSLQVICLARRLNIPPQQVRHALRAGVGQRLAGGTLLARGPGLFQRVLMPSAATLTAIDDATGSIVLRGESVTEVIRTAVRGVVMAASGDAGVTIETPAAQVALVLALVRARKGMLRVMSGSASEPIADRDIDERAHGALLIGGSIGAAALKRAAEVGAAGIIVGGISSHDLRTFLGITGDADWRGLLNDEPGTTIPALPLSMMLTEGFSAGGMHPTAFAVLSRYDRRPAVIDSRRFPAADQRHRLLIPITADRPIHLHAGHPRLRVGSQVRLLTEPYLGHTAIVRSLQLPGVSSAGLTRCETAEVATHDGRLLQIPVTLIDPLA